jgi:hypothetical protein
MTGDRRLDRVSRIADGPDGVLELAFRAIEQRRWTFHDIYVLLDGDEQLSRLRRQLVDRAIDTRQRRVEHGDPPVLGDAFSVGAEITSYRPAEEVPDNLAPIIDRHTDMLGGARRFSLNWHYGFIAAFTKLILRTPDAIELRREIWGDETAPRTVVTA